MKSELWMYKELERCRKKIMSYHTSEAEHDKCVARVELLEIILDVKEENNNK